MIIKAPDEFRKFVADRVSIFLGGSIEMGKAIDWQSDITNKLETAFGDKILVLNPRRDDWDSSWVQSKDNHQFREQVEWELIAQTQSEALVYYFAVETKSPITLLELGLFSGRKPITHLELCPVTVYCPEGFWRKGNVDIVCEWTGIPVYEDYEKFVQAVVEKVSLLIMEHQEEKRKKEWKVPAE